MVAARRSCKRCDNPLSKQRAAKRKKYCYLCEVAARRDARAKAHDQRVAAVYGLNPGEYALLLEAQDGRCFICQRATGKTRRLAVDHDHKLFGRASVRGLLCGLCNNMIGHSRDNPDFFNRAMEYLSNPPARKVLK